MRLALGACSLVVLVVLSVSAQVSPAAKLGVWTNQVFENRHYDRQKNPYLRTVRVVRQKTFDRLVFEFDGPLPDCRIDYLKSRFYEGEDGRERIRIVGRAFIRIDLSQISADEKQLSFSDAKHFLPKGKLRLPTLLQMQDKGVGEGHYEFLLGLSARKAYRVTELENPSRVVIDLKH